jgi:hypothetical protein
MRSRLCFDGLDMRCCIEAMSYLVKTVKDHFAIKTYLNGPRNNLGLRL